MPAAITALYAAILALMVTALAINVTVHRVKLKVAVGDGDNPQMLRMIRLHGNAAEYVPLALALMLAYELNGGAPVVLHIAGIVLVAGRILHAWGLWQADAPNLRRASGQTLTWLAIATLAALNLWQVA